MIIKEEISEQDSIDIGIELYNLVGMPEKKLRKSRNVWFLNLFLGILMILVGLNSFKRNETNHLFFTSFFLLLGTVYVIWSLYSIIFLKRNYKSRLIKSLKKYNETVRQKYHISDTYEVITEIKDGYIETSSLGTITKYSLTDFVAKIENENFYIFEFTNGRYIIFKKSNFENIEKYDELVNEIEKGK